MFTFLHAQVFTCAPAERVCGKCTWCTAGLLCLFCCQCMLFAFCCSQDVVHSCPACGTVFGARWRRATDEVMLMAALHDTLILLCFCLQVNILESELHTRCLLPVRSSLQFIRISANEYHIWFHAAPLDHILLQFNCFTVVLFNFNCNKYCNNKPDNLNCTRTYRT